MMHRSMDFRLAFGRGEEYVNATETLCEDADMMDGQTLEHLNRQATRRAARAKRAPVVIEQQDIDAYRTGDPDAIKLHYVGDRTPRGWARIDITGWPGNRDYMPAPGAFFVDTWGGPSDGRALSQEEFVAAIKPGYGYGVIESGEFQCFVGVFRSKLAGGSARS
jgi:hypothetical protein